MTYLYTPKITVTIRREIGTTAEYEQTLTEIGDVGLALERIVISAIALALMSKPKQVSET